MPRMTEYNYLFAIGTMFSLLDAYNIGANDVANSWATSISSRSVTMKQAAVGAGIMEFLGAVTVGARVADTIKNGIIPASVFRSNPGVQLLAFTCAITASASWLMFCTYMSFPVSTTYSIVASVAGVGVAVAGADSVVWGWNKGKGMGAIFAGLLLAPCLAAGFGGALYLIIKFGVLRRKNSNTWAIFTGPFFFFLAAAVCTMSIIYKGAPSLGLANKGPTTTALGIVLTALVVSVLAGLFWVPYVYAKVIKKDYTVRWYHMFQGPLLWKRQAPADALDGRSTVPDYRVVQDDKGNAVGVVQSSSNSGTEGSLDGEEKIYPTEDAEKQAVRESPVMATPKKTSLLARQLEALDRHPLEEGAWYDWANLKIIVRHRAVPKIISVLTYGLNYDVHAAQAGEAGTKDGNRMAAVYSQATQYPNEVEHTYSFLQVFSACVASFAHGANDVSNAIGPWTVIYQVWNTGAVTGKGSTVPIWILVVGGAMLVIGFVTYGYNIVRVLGNKITYVSPSRGVSMELGAAITVILASQYGLPVSTTMCITGATVGVGLCNGNLHAVNWRAIGWIFMGWIITIPLAGTLAGCLMGIVLNAPHF